MAATALGGAQRKGKRIVARSNGMRKRRIGSWLETLEIRQALAADTVAEVSTAGGLAATAVASDQAEGELGANPVPDFSLTDVNPNSATYNQTVSPRQYLGKITAWYFGHST